MLTKLANKLGYYRREPYIDKNNPEMLQALKNIVILMSGQKHPSPMTDDIILELAVRTIAKVEKDR